MSWSWVQCQLVWWGRCNMAAMWWSWKTMEAPRLILQHNMERNAGVSSLQEKKGSTCSCLLHFKHKVKITLGCLPVLKWCMRECFLMLVSDTLKTATKRVGLTCAVHLARHRPGRLGCLELFLAEHGAALCLQQFCRARISCSTLQQCLRSADGWGEQVAFSLSPSQTPYWWRVACWSHVPLWAGIWKRTGIAAECKGDLKIWTGKCLAAEIQT